MQLITHTLALLILAHLGTQVCAVSIPTTQNTRRSSSQCQPLYSTFEQSDVAHSPYSSNTFVGVSPQGSYGVDSSGLTLYLEKPKQPVKTKDGVNDVVAEGATVNSTFTILYGRVSFKIAAPTVAGVVTAAILLAEEHDEIDIELLGGDPNHWQSNIFTTSPKNQEPLWGVFGQIEGFPKKSTISSTHNYTIDWNSERIIWTIDGSVVRTLEKADTKINGTYHFPSHAARIQLGIWDASNPAGTSEWARGPIDWSTAPPKMAATFRSIAIDCPY